MNVLFVTDYPPPFDAATFAAVDHVRALRSAGARVEVLSPDPSGAHHHLDLGSWWNVVSLIRLVRAFDRVVVARSVADAPPLRFALRRARVTDSWVAPDLPRQPSIPAITPEEWPPDRDAAMAEIRARAAHRNASRQRSRGEAGPLLRRIPPLTLPFPEMARPSAALAKRLVRRLTAWQIDPIVARLNLIRETLVDVFEAEKRR